MPLWLYLLATLPIAFIVWKITHSWAHRRFDRSNSSVDHWQNLYGKARQRLDALEDDRLELASLRAQIREQTTADRYLAARRNISSGMMTMTTIEEDIVDEPPDD